MDSNFIKSISFEPIKKYLDISRGSKIAKNAYFSTFFNLFKKKRITFFKQFFLFSINLGPYLINIHHFSSISLILGLKN
jgi:hypothetical protein